MKKIFVIILAVLFLALSQSVFAQTTKPTTKPTLKPSTTPEVSKEAQEIDTIEKIKDLVASKVAELKLVDKRGIMGIVKSSSNTQITIDDNKGGQRVIDIDELTKFETDDEDESFGISDVKKGDNLSFIGLFNKDTKRLLARFISKLSSIPTNIEGVVYEKNPKEFTLTIVTADGKKKTIDVQTSTKTSIYEDGETTKSGFTKITAGERVLVVGFNSKDDENAISASRIIHFPNIALSQDLKKYKDLLKIDAPTSTGSAGSVKPITR